MAVDMFIKIGDVKGEARDKSHKDEIDVLAWSWGASNSGSMHVGGGGGSGKANVQDISLTKWMDKASPFLLKAVCDGQHFPKATLVVRKAGQTPLEYMTIIMTKVLISSLSTGGSGGEDRLTENITLNFEEFEIKYVPQKEDGSPDSPIPFKWNIAENA
jgi:type VI secretion system secreted protein Hcp